MNVDQRDVTHLTHLTEEAPLPEASFEGMSVSDRLRRGIAAEAAFVEGGGDAARAYMVGAHAAGYGHTKYLQGRLLLRNADENPERYGDLIEQLNLRKKVRPVYDEMRARRSGKKPERRHMILDGMMHPRPNVEMERAVYALEGICMALDKIDAKRLDDTRRTEWCECLKEVAFKVAVFAGQVRSSK